MALKLEEEISISCTMPMTLLRAENVNDLQALIMKVKEYKKNDVSMIKYKNQTNANSIL